MKTQLLAYLVLATGLVLSSAAGFYSIIGLTAIFSGAFWPIVIMGSTLELAKLVSVSWLYNYWNDTPRIIKYYLVFAIIVLMLITSMGIFGFLSRAHIEQQLKINTGVANQIELIDNSIKTKELEIVDIEKQISVIDNSINKLIEKGQARSSLNAADQQKKNREQLVKNKDAKIIDLTPLREKKIGLEAEMRKVEAEVGPIKYVAELIYGESDAKILDKAVRFVIIILIFVFDPLAVLLLLAFNISIRVKDDYETMEFMEMKPLKKPRKRKETFEDSEKKTRPIPASIIRQEAQKLEGGEF